MIIVERKNIENSVYFPKNIYTKNTGIYKLVLEDRGTNTRHEFAGLEDKRLVEYDFYSFFVNFKNLPEGEYEYTIFDSNDEITGKGIIRLNELKQENTYYNKNNEFIAYDRQ